MNPGLAIEAVNTVYRAASNLAENIRRRLYDLRSMWTLCQVQGLVPQTSVFRQLGAELDAHINELRVQRILLCERMGRFESPTDGAPDWAQAPGDWDSTQARSLREVKRLLFDRLLLYSEALTYLTQHISSRAGLLAASEATHGSHLTAHRYMGMGSVYDAAESLMADYASGLTSAGSSSYDGLVVFGYDFQAAAWLSRLTTFPLFAEHEEHFAMLVILAHEAAHWLQRSGPLEEFRRKVEEQLRALDSQPLNTDGDYTGSLLPLLGAVSVDSHTRFHPLESQYRRIAGEIAADVFATLVAGPAYPRILARYFLPLYVDPVIPRAYPEDSGERDRSWAFWFSSFKLRVAADTAFLAGYISRAEVEAMGEHARLCEWVMADVVANYSPEVPPNPVLAAALRLAMGLPDGGALPSSSVVLERIRSGMENLARGIVRSWGNVDDSESVRPANRGIVRVFQETVPCVETYWSLDDTDATRRTAAETAWRDVFRGPRPLDELLSVWRNESLWRPRHLLNALVPEFGSPPPRADLPESEQVNRLGIILTLAHHPSILERYQQIGG